MIHTELLRLGFGDATTEILDTWLQNCSSDRIPNWNYSEQTKQFTNGIRHISEISLVKIGSFGQIYLVYYKGLNTEEYAFMKLKKTNEHLLLKEGLIQSIARAALKTHGIEYAIPRVHTFFRHPKLGFGLCLQRIIGSQILSDYFQTHIQWNTPTSANDTLFFSVLVQLASYLAILQEEHGLLHGDLKSTNLLLVVPCDEYTKQLQIQNTKWCFQSSIKLVMIDFGFAVIEKAVTPTTKSRDLFFLLCTLWNIPEFRRSLTSSGKKLIKKWLHDGKTDWAKWLEFSTEDNIHGMYLFTDSAGFRSVSCQPLLILEDIQSVYPELVSIEAFSN